jgi:uncharacterized protein YutE (UPF0331/DUF86 family)/predicted nucleotidyltransferase
MEREAVIVCLRDFFSKCDDVRLAILFGSLADRGFSAHDVDVAVELDGDGGRLLRLGGLGAGIAGALGLSEDRVDIVDLDQASLPLLWRILKSYLLLKGDEGDLRGLEERVRGYPDAALEIEGWMSLNPRPMVDKAVLAARAEEVRRNVLFLRGEILGRGLVELAYKDLLAMEGAVQRISEAMLDVCRHLVAVHSLGLVEGYGEYPRRLADAGKMPPGLARELQSLAGLRNTLVHRYLEVRVELLYEASRKICEGLAERFLNWVEGIDP